MTIKSSKKDTKKGEEFNLHLKNKSISFKNKQSIDKMHVRKQPDQSVSSMDY